MTLKQKLAAGAIAALAIAGAAAEFALGHSSSPEPPGAPAGAAEPKPFCIPGTGCDP